MPAADLAAADGLARSLAWLSAHTTVTEALGGTGRVGARNDPPYPRLVLTDTPGGSDRNLRWLLTTELQVEALGDLDGSPGKAALRRILYVALAALTEMPEQPVERGQPVVTNVSSRGGGGWTPLPTGQPRYVATVLLSTHPPQP